MSREVGADDHCSRFPSDPFCDFIYVIDTILRSNKSHSKLLFLKIYEQKELKWKTISEIMNKSAGRMQSLKQYSEILLVYEVHLLQ